MLGQIAVDEKLNEISAMPALLDLDGRIVTADAMHTQRGTVGAIRAQGGDYVLALKGNQGTLLASVSLEYELHEGLMLDAGYRYLDEEGVTSNTLGLLLTYDLSLR